MEQAATERKRNIKRATTSAIPCLDPATGEHLGRVPAWSKADVAAAVTRARAAQVRWGATSMRERRRVLGALLERIVESQEEIAAVCVRDSGKTLLDAAMGEIFPVCEKLRYLIAQGERDLASEPRGSGIMLHKRVRVEWQPLGVIGVICPFNFPFHNVFCPALPALFAGNAVIAKISEHTSYSAELFSRIFSDVLTRFGQSPDLVQLVTGGGETGAALVTSGVDKIFFTGSPENGRRVMAGASETLTPVVLELGGKDPMIVCDDADLDQAVGAAMLGVYTACGQMCVAAERLYVMDGIYDRFVAALADKVRALRQGPPSRDAGGEFDVGATTMARQLEIIETLVADAVKKGARVLAGGKRNASLDGQFFEPTLVVDATHDMRLVREEAFGPVATVIRVRDEEEAVRLANDTAYGLGSSVFTKSAARAERIAAKLSAGMTVVNDYGIAYMVQSAPFGGVRLSGFGRINGREGLRACCNEKTVVTDRLPLHMSMSFYPVKKDSYPLMRDVISVIYARGLGRKAKALMRLGRSAVSIVTSPR